MLRALVVALALLLTGCSLAMECMGEDGALAGCREEVSPALEYPVPVPGYRDDAKAASWVSMSAREGAGT